MRYRSARSLRLGLSRPGAAGFRIWHRHRVTPFADRSPISRPLRATGAIHGIRVRFTPVQNGRMHAAIQGMSPVGGGTDIHAGHARVDHGATILADPLASALQQKNTGSATSSPCPISRTAAFSRGKAKARDVKSRALVQLQVLRGSGRSARSGPMKTHSFCWCPGHAGP